LLIFQIHKAKDAPLDLIPDAKPLPPDFAKKMSPNIAQQSSYAAQSTPNAQSLGSFGNPAPRPPLPTDNHGKLDLNRLQLPPGEHLVSKNQKSTHRRRKTG
jgi:hypothetical protein